MAKKKTETAAQIDERRRKGRIKAQKYRDRIKNNPDLQVLEKLAEAERYQKRVASKQLKKIGDLSKRDQRSQRKKWRKNTANHRNNKNADALLEKHLANNTPPESPEPGPLLVPTIPTPDLSQKGSSRAKCGRKRVARDRANVYRALKKKEQELEKAKKKAGKYKKRYQRLLASTKTATESPAPQQLSASPSPSPKQLLASTKTVTLSPSPRTKVKTLIKGFKVSPEIVKRLEFGESVVSQLKITFNSLTDNVEKRKFNRTIGSKFLKKYRLMVEARSIFKQQRTKVVNKKKVGAITQEICQLVIKFLEEDENSRLSPGKKDCITRSKIKKQKRRLCFSMLELHEKFISNTSMKMSYVSFCRLRPFWIVQPTVNDRETCLCIICDNMQFLVSKAYDLKLMAEKSVNSLSNIFCCLNRNETCMLGKCEDCKFKTIPLTIPAVEAKDSVNYFQWVCETETRSAHGKSFEVKVTLKKQLSCTKEELVDLINKRARGKVLQHLCNMDHQFKAMKELKKNLTVNEVLIHVDFSENYLCKYGSEIQAVHFGASHRQVTLHTGVYYYICCHTNEIKCQSFCTVSENNRHDACAIWVHLLPILQEIKIKIPNIEVVHFLSDSPSTQYRNKTMFLLFTRFLPTLFPLKMASWNYSEAGHGKGAPDGIGGVIKRTADKLVAKNNDIPDATVLCSLLIPRCPSIQIILISTLDPRFLEIDSLIPDGLKSIPGTMQVHQVAWHSNNLGKLSIRSLSCFKCPMDLNCDEYGLSPYKPVSIVHLKPVTNQTEDDEVIIEQEDLEVGDQDHALEMVPVLGVAVDVLQPNISDDNHRLIGKGEWVAVIFDDVWYPGIVEAAKDGLLTVTFMSRTGKHFKWPEIADRHTIKSDNILCKINEGPYPISSRLSSFKNIDQINRLMKD